MSATTTPVQKNTGDKKLIFTILGLSCLGILCVLCAFTGAVFAVAYFEEQSLDTNDTTFDFNIDTSNDTSDFFNNSDDGVKTITANGDTAEAEGHKVTILSTELDYQTDDFFAEPDAGNQLFVVEVRIENTSSENITANPFNFTLYDSKENSYTYNFFGAEPSLGVEVLGENKSTEGYVTFEVPSDETDFVLQYEPSFFSEEIIEFNL
ncbi:DUF4352 domain-containing protein [Candidatus Dojkabacteria bacterium]|uniref:DUF4352 domain-containing protein n=1 Tax=Candidatus Dojkabacteria bacterium TaxID=2099670 RepID=A0A955RJ83_9BACT|nr:DUF4352 domain-containing protein [Candidatus Dojkabacteria bacterium]